MATQVFINLPVKNLQQSVDFFTKLGYTFNAQFTDENATCMVISDTIYVMLLVAPYFQTFTSKPVNDAFKTTEMILCLSAESREAVDELVGKAFAAGAGQHNEKKDFGWMYIHGFQDLDGHLWEITYMDPAGYPAE